MNRWLALTYELSIYGVFLAKLLYASRSAAGMADPKMINSGE